MSHPPGPPNEGEPTPQEPPVQAEGEPGGPDAGQAGGTTGPGAPHGIGPPPPSAAYYPPPPYGPAGYGPGALPRTNGKATAALITGVSTLVLSWCCGLGLAGVVAVVLGIKARREIRDGGGAQSGDGMAIGGIVTGALAILFGLVGLVVVIALIATGNVDFSTSTSHGTNS